MKKILIVFICSFLLLGCSTPQKFREVNDNSILQDKYKTEPFIYDVFIIDFNDLEKLSQEKYTGLVLFTRIDCSYCKENFNNLVSALILSDSFTIKEILVIETDSLNDQQKSEMIKTYNVSFVPTHTIFSRGKITDTIVGVLSEEQFTKISKG